MTGIPIKRGKLGTAYIWGEHHMNRRTAIYKPKILPPSPQKEPTLPSPRFQTSILQNYPI